MQVPALRLGQVRQCSSRAVYSASGVRTRAGAWWRGSAPRWRNSRFRPPYPAISSGGSAWAGLPLLVHHKSGYAARRQGGGKAVRRQAGVQFRGTTCSGAAKVLWAAGATGQHAGCYTRWAWPRPSMQVTGIAAVSFRLAAVTRILPSACWLALTCRSGTAWSSWFSRVVSA